MAEPRVLPAWAEELRRRYVRSEASLFVLYGNVFDLLLHQGKLYRLTDFLSDVLLGDNKETIALYNLSSGVRFAKRGGRTDGLEELLLQKSADKVLPAFERILQTQDRLALIIEYAEMIAPMGDANFFSEADRQSVVMLHRWSLAPHLESADNIVLLVTENLAELHPKIVSNPKVATIRVPMPDRAERKALVRHVVPDMDEAWADRLAEITAGLKAIQLKGILEPTPPAAEDAQDREKLIVRLLGDGALPDRVKRLVQLTEGMKQGEICDLVAPKAAPGAAPAEDEAEREQRAEILRIIARRKREIIERECLGLIEFVEPEHDFSVVGGMDEVKRDLLTVAKNIREGRRNLCPMGILFTGPMGTGKTFVAEAFAKECGLTTIKFKNFRSKWVGATEGNLEKILTVIQAIGQVLVIIDEGDRAFGNSGDDGDGGTSSRVIARIKEFMSDTENRGRVVFILMTNRPDKLDIDIKRAGRLDKKIPFLYPQTAEDLEQVLLAQLRKHKLKADVVFPRDRDAVSAPLVGFSNADVEAITLLANQYASEAAASGDAAIDPAVMARAVADYLPSRDVQMLEYMELLAVFEASNRRMLPRKYAELSVEELQLRLARLRLEIGTRR
ncbi:MAG TPA: ATP-binding protein [Polyangia bacterium]|jgi:AAA+ superfamily predicted ATPase